MEFFVFVVVGEGLGDVSVVVSFHFEVEEEVGGEGGGFEEVVVDVVDEGEGEGDGLVFNTLFCFVYYFEIGGGVCGFLEKSLEDF